jgi:hypothetical protein
MILYDFLLRRLSSKVIPRHKAHVKHRLLLSRMRVYWPVTYQWIYVNHIENTFCNVGSIVAYGYFRRCLEMVLHVTIICSDGQKIHLLSCNLQVHCRVHKSPTLVNFLSQKNPVHTFAPSTLNININSILPFSPKSLEFSFVHVKGKKKLFLCLITHYAMKTCGGVEV